MSEAHKKGRKERELAYRRRRLSEAAAGVGTYRSACSSISKLVPDGIVGSNTVDIIFTDPPYPRKYLSVFSDLAAFAVQSLRPGGMLVAIVGICWLPEYLNRLLVDGLSYRWMMTLTLPGCAGRNFPRRVAHSTWKPVVVMTKDGAFPDRWISHDWVKCDSRSKQAALFHKWGQSPEGQDALVERLQFKPCSVVVDPFVGGGECALAAYRVGCHVLAADIDPSVEGLNITNTL